MDPDAQVSRLHVSVTARPDGAGAALAVHSEVCILSSGVRTELLPGSEATLLVGDALFLCHSGSAAGGRVSWESRFAYILQLEEVPPSETQPVHPVEPPQQQRVPKPMAPPEDGLLLSPPPPQAPQQDKPGSGGSGKRKRRVPVRRHHGPPHTP